VAENYDGRSKQVLNALFQFTYLLTYLLTYSLHGAGRYLKS